MLKSFLGINMAMAFAILGGWLVSYGMKIENENEPIAFTLYAVGGVLLFIGSVIGVISTIGFIFTFFDWFFFNRG